MEYRGHVEDGKVILNEPAALPDGAEVSVRPLRMRRKPARRRLRPPTLYEQLKPFIGKVTGMPADLARNHDHYLHGTPKK